MARLFHIGAATPSSRATQSPRRRRRGSIGLRIAVLLAGLLAGTAARANLQPGDSFPSLVAAGLAGAPPPATAGKVVLVDFWASWCAPCRMSFPAYAKLQADYRAHGLIVVAVSVDENPAAYEAFVKRLNPSFVVMRDQAQRLVHQVKVPAMPTCYLLGRDGRVRFVHQGFHGDDTERELRREIVALLTENPRSP
ncbi:MAG: TlpA disulfide reductase family protein [Opitutaceae bacterium]